MPLVAASSPPRSYRSTYAGEAEGGGGASFQVRVVSAKEDTAAVERERQVRQHERDDSAAVAR